MYAPHAFNLFNVYFWTFFIHLLLRIDHLNEGTAPLGLWTESLTYTCPIAGRERFVA